MSSKATWCVSTNSQLATGPSSKHEVGQSDRIRQKSFRTGGRWAQVNGRYVEIAKEIVRPDSRLAYSQRTRDYLRRRTWRSLPIR